MGFYIILRNDEDGIISEYIDHIEDLASIPNLTKDAIIYQGEREWRPFRLDQHEKGKVFLNEKFKAGVKAQVLFQKQALEAEWIAEVISQDQTSFEVYTHNTKLSIKRGDFLIRNAGNLEIEVKCLTYYEKQGEYFIYLSYRDLKKHENMEKITKVPVVIAFYKREGSEPDPDSLRMIMVKHILDDGSIEYDDHCKCKVIPIAKALPGFKIVEDFKDGKV